MYLVFAIKVYYQSITAYPPEIVKHPQGQTQIPIGTNVEFSIEALGTLPLVYSWEWKPANEDGSPEQEWRSLPTNVERFKGVNTPTLLLSNVKRSDAGSYRCAISNGVGRGVQSEPATLTVCKNIE